MGKFCEYKAVKRVVKDENVIGFMVYSQKDKKEVFMSFEVMKFGLENKMFEIEDVKIGNTGKPRGCNGFLLSKLPIVEIKNGSMYRNFLLSVLYYILKGLCFEDIDLEFENVAEIAKFEEEGVNLKCIGIIKISEYATIENKYANEIIKRNIRYYEKVMPSKFKENYTRIESVVNEEGYLTVSVIKSLVEEEKGCTH